MKNILFNLKVCKQVITKLMLELAPEQELFESWSWSRNNTGTGEPSSNHVISNNTASAHSDVISLFYYILL
jgi:hypothetical protein